MSYGIVADELNYQAAIVGKETVPQLRPKAKFDFLRGLAKQLKSGQALRLILPSTVGKNSIGSVWYAIKGKGKGHILYKKNENNVICYLWFE